MKSARPTVSAGKKETSNEKADFVGHRISDSEWI
jgi:hypothetical protein